MRKNTTATEWVAEGLTDQWTASQYQKQKQRRLPAMEGNLPEMDKFHAEYIWLHPGRG